MPKGESGCYLCGGPPSVIFLVWLREYVEEKVPGSPSRRQRTVDSVGRTLCERCAVVEEARAAAAQFRRWPRVHGCGRCGERSVFRVQVWVRTLREDGARTLWSVSRSYCAGHAGEVYALLGGRLGVDERRTRGGGVGGSDLSGARARAAR